MPDQVIEALGSGTRAWVVIVVGGHSCLTTAVRLGGRFFGPQTAENRGADGIAAGEKVSALRTAYHRDRFEAVVGAAS